MGQLVRHRLLSHRLDPRRPLLQLVGPALELWLGPRLALGQWRPRSRPRRRAGHLSAAVQRTEAQQSAGQQLAAAPAVGQSLAIATAQPVVGPAESVAAPTAASATPGEPAGAVQSAIAVVAAVVSSATAATGGCAAVISAALATPAAKSPAASAAAASAIGRCQPRGRLIPKA